MRIRLDTEGLCIQRNWLPANWVKVQRPRVRVKKRSSSVSCISIVREHCAVGYTERKLAEKKQVTWYWLQPMGLDEVQPIVKPAFELSLLDRGERDGGLDKCSRLCLLVSVPLYIHYLRAQGTAQETTITEWRSAERRRKWSFIFLTFKTSD